MIYKKITGNKCYSSLILPFKSKNLSKKLIIKLYKTRVDSFYFMRVVHKSIHRIWRKQTYGIWDKNIWQWSKIKQRTGNFIIGTHFVNVLKSQKIIWAFHIWRADNQIIRAVLSESQINQIKLTTKGMT